MLRNYKGVLPPITIGNIWCDDFQLQQEEVSAVQENEVDQENKETSCKEEIYSRAVFVNTRRGKGNGTQRKISDTVNVKECESNIAPSAVQVFYVAQIYVANKLYLIW